MEHLDDEAVTRAGTHEGRAALTAAARAHLDTCALCEKRVLGTERLAAVLREEEPDPAVPSFDTFIAPHLTPQRAPEPAPAPAPEPEPVPVPAPRVTAGRAAHLALAVTWRQVRLVPPVLSSAVVAGFAVLALALALLPSRPAGPYVEAVTVGLVTIAGVVACDPRRDPRREALHAMLVPPLAVWFARLVLVLGTVLALAFAVSALAGAVPGGRPLPDLVGSWLPPALLGAALTVFGTVWRSPAVGLVLGGVSWAMALAVLRSSTATGVFGAVAAPLWADLTASVTVAALVFAGAAWLVTRPGRSVG